jgi:hypothetical protein
MTFKKIIVVYVENQLTLKIVHDICGRFVEIIAVKVDGIYNYHCPFNDNYSGWTYG